MSETFNTDYLKFDASSMKTAIMQKLSQNSDFTDHLFEDSNLTILIDVFAYTFQVLMFYVNHGASEAMFTDSVLYENMNRLVKMLGYNPFGTLASKTSAIFTNINQAVELFTDASKILPKYSYVNTELTDKVGKPIYYSTINLINIERLMLNNNTDKTTLVNGKWKLYTNTFNGAGVPFEQFTLSQLNLQDTDNPLYIAHPYIDVFVKRRISNEEFEYHYFAPISDGTLFGKGTSLVGPDDKVFELRLNENKQYTLKFGDGINGTKLQENDEVYVVYLESNGDAGKIGAGVITEKTMSYGIDGLDNATFIAFLSALGIQEDNLMTDAELLLMYVQNVDASSTPVSFEDVDSIRSNAPNWFRMGGRLITANDYTQYINATYKNDLYDTLVMNNWEYMTSFHRWLYEYDKLTIDIRNLNYVYADSCDFNNVYIWMKLRTPSLDFSSMEQDILTKKVLTSEPIFVEAIDKIFVPAYKAFDADEDPLYALSDWDPSYENWIEILKDKNSIISAEKIKTNALNTIQNFFNPDILVLGQRINIDELYNKLLKLEGVKSVYTVYKKSSDPQYSAQYYNGLSFAAWTPKLINGLDLSIITGNIELEKFQFPTLLTTNLINRIKVVFETLGQPSIEF